MTTPEERPRRKSVLDALDEAQIEAALRRSPLIILEGGPGTGKTRTLVARVAEQIRAGTPYERVACCTFTRAAAGHFREELRAVCTEVPDKNLHALGAAIDAHAPFTPRRLDRPAKPMIGTIHELCARIVRATPAVLEWPEQIHTMSPAESQAGLRSALVQTGLKHDDDRLERACGALARQISKRKRAGLRAEGADPICGPAVPGTRPPALHGRDADAAAIADRRARSEGRMDYDDILCLAWWILTTDEHARHAWRRRFDQIVVDEVQDTEPIQLAIIAMIAGDAEVMCAGDSSQAIYGWRGAIGGLDARSLGPVVRVKGEPDVLTLCHDYRHTHTLANAAGHLKGHMTDQIGSPTVRYGRGTKSGTPHDAAYVEVENEDDEHHAVHAAIELAEPDWSIAVLCRTRARCERAARELANTGRKIWLNIDAEPGGPAGILLAWLNAAASGSEAALEAALCAHQPMVRLAAFDIARHWSAPLTERLRRTDVRARLGERAGAAATLWHHIASTTEDDRPGAARRLVWTIVDGAKLAKISEKASPQAEKQYLRTSGVIRTLLRRGATISELASTLIAPLAAEHLVEPPKDVIVVGTMHGAKGLEADLVVSPGWVRGVMPASFGTNEEEERKVAFVTLTRARKQFVATGFTKDGETSSARTRSPFVHETRLHERTLEEIKQRTKPRTRR